MELAPCRQTLVKKLFFQVRQIVRRILTKAALRPAALSTQFKVFSQRLPRLSILQAELLGRLLHPWRTQNRYHAYRAPQDECPTYRSPPTRPSLMVPQAAEAPLKIVIR